MPLVELSLLLEGEAGVGNMEVEKFLAAARLAARLARLQRGKGLDQSDQIYDQKFSTATRATREENELRAKVHSSEFLYPPQLINPHVERVAAEASFAIAQVVIPRAPERLIET